MTNHLNKLRKENNRQDRKLTPENNNIMTDVICYLRSSNLCEYDLEVIRKDLLGMALESQIRGDTLQNVIGADYKSFCQELISNGRQKSVYEKTLEALFVFSFVFTVLYICEMIFSSTVFNAVKFSQFNMHITLGFVIGSLLIILMGYSIYYFIAKRTFEFTEKDRKTQFTYIIGFMVLWSLSFLSRSLFDETILCTVNSLFPLLVSCLFNIIIQWLTIKHANHYFEL